MIELIGTIVEMVHTSKFVGYLGRNREDTKIILEGNQARRLEAVTKINCTTILTMFDLAKL